MACFHKNLAKFGQTLYWKTINTVENNAEKLNLRDSKCIVWNIDTDKMSNIICMFIDLLEAQPKVNKLFYKYQENII